MMSSFARDFRRAEAITISCCRRCGINSRIFGFLPYSIASSSRQRWADLAEFARMVFCLALLQLVNSIVPPAVTLAAYYGHRKRGFKREKTVRKKVADLSCGVNSVKP